MTKPGLEGFGMVYQPYTPIILWMPSDSDAGRNYEMIPDVPIKVYRSLE
jgi:hypothetical protein